MRSLAAATVIAAMTGSFTLAGSAEADGRVTCGERWVTPHQSVYCVQDGDTLWQVSVQFYGDGALWPTIAKANHIVTPRTLQAGRLLLVPRN